MPNCRRLPHAASSSSARACEADALRGSRACSEAERAQGQHSRRHETRRGGAKWPRKGAAQRPCASRARSGRAASRRQAGISACSCSCAALRSRVAGCGAVPGSRPRRHQANALPPRSLQRLPHFAAALPPLAALAGGLSFKRRAEAGTSRAASAAPSRAPRCVCVCVRQAAPHAGDTRSAQGRRARGRGPRRVA